MKISISKALKIKNRIAGELAKIEELFKSSNCRREGDDSSIDPSLLYGEWEQSKNLLILIKQKIATASAGIQATLVELAEAKSAISFHEKIIINEGVAMDYSTTVPRQIPWVNTITKSDQRYLINKINKYGNGVDW